MMKHSETDRYPAKAGYLTLLSGIKETNILRLAQPQAPIIVQLPSSATSFQIKQYPMTLDT